MIVLKFGGTSVGSARNMKKVAKIITSIDTPKFVVFSAMSGTTNTLLLICDFYKEGNLTEAEIEIEKLHKKYQVEIQHLFENKEYLTEAKVLVSFIFNRLNSLLEEQNIINTGNEILAQGELLSTQIFKLYLDQENISSNLIPALSIMKIDKMGEPDKAFTANILQGILHKKQDNSIFITQGFICRNTLGDIDNLGRGGSDYTASLIGAAINADQIQIYTDIDGMHNNDPRYVDHTFSIEEISFDEAAELAYFGAKILHPQSLLPAKENNIPVLVKNTFEPLAKGTLICNNPRTDYHIRAVAAKDNIIAIKIKSFRMLLAYGFLKKIFEIFDHNKTSIDMITTSEVAVSLTIDNTKNIDQIINELSSYGSVEVDSKLSIICIAGDIAQNKKGITAEIFNSLTDIPIRMISYGGSNYNLSFLVKTNQKTEVLNLLNNSLFDKEKFKKTIKNKAFA